MRPKPLHNAAWWAARTKGIGFSIEGHLDSAKANRIVWSGVMGDKPYPTVRSGANLHMNRAAILQHFRATQQQADSTAAPVPAEPSSALAQDNNQR